MQYIICAGFYTGLFDGVLGKKSGFGIDAELRDVFSFFKRSTPKEKLQEKYRRLMKESMELSRTDRRMADIKRASADEVLKKLEALEGP